MNEPKEPSVREPYMSESKHQGHSLQPKSAMRFMVPIIAALLIFYVLVLYPLPYYIFSPGTAENIRPMVQVTQGGFPEKGALMLTTVSVSDANIASYILERFNPNEELYKKSSIRQPGESENQYNQRQSYIMQTSQSSAMQAAYLKAGIPYHVHIDKVIVLYTMKGMPADAVLKEGDTLVKIETQAIQSAEDIVNYLKTKKAGDTVKITYLRDAKEQVANLTLALLPQTDAEKAAKAEPKAGVGIMSANVQSIRADDPNKQVTVQAGDIGGPSAGLMFTLEIYNQLVAGDITKGYRIAGTGTIDDKGNVGPIGGIQHKIVAAERQGAAYFFAPAENVKEAQDKANKIHAKLKIISVTTMEDAFKFLAALPPKAT
jgi:PDZ domain-containing protein